MPQKINSLAKTSEVNTQNRSCSRVRRASQFWRKIKELSCIWLLKKEKEETRKNKQKKHSGWMPSPSPATRLDLNSQVIVFPPHTKSGDIWCIKLGCKNLKKKKKNRSHSWDPSCKSVAFSNHLAIFYFSEITDTDSLWDSLCRWFWQDLFRA